ncbi:MAG: sodium-dependent transporter [Spirochaetota bacterium]
MTNPNPKERWASKLGVILVVASSAIGLGNFLRFPGQAAQNGGGAFMIPYIISFLLLGIPICLSEWIMGRMGNRYGHSTPSIFRYYLSGIPLRIASTIALIIPVVIYIYYVYIEAWCLSYAVDFITGSISLAPEGITSGTKEFTSAVVKNADSQFINLTGAHTVGAAFSGRILKYIFICYALNFFLVYLGISKGLEAFAKKAVPLLLICAAIVLVRVITLDGITEGLGFMWNPNWESLKQGKVWVAAAGQIFFSLSVGFGIVLSFSSYLSKKDDVVLSGLSAASVNEFVEVALGGMITIPIGFLFLGAAVSKYGTFGMGFIALPSVFAMMPGGQVFGSIWFFVLFIAAITSSVSMIQPGISFLEEGFGLVRKASVSVLLPFTLATTMLIAYFNKDFLALDLTDFWIGTFLIYILATLQTLIYGWKIGPEAGRKHSEAGALLPLPKFFDFIIKYITPLFLLVIFAVFAYQSLPGYFEKMNPELMQAQALANNKSVEEAKQKAEIARGVFLALLVGIVFFYNVVHFGLKNIERKYPIEPDKS